MVIIITRCIIVIVSVGSVQWIIIIGVRVISRLLIWSIRTIIIVTVRSSWYRVRGGDWNRLSSRIYQWILHS